MDLQALLRNLQAEKSQLERTIAALESLGSNGRRRGRKSMGTAERHEVSLRMKRYWAQRRKAS